MKQVTQNMRDGKTIVQDIPNPSPQRGQALIKVANSLVSAGTERMLVEFGEKSLVGKARSRPDLVKQVVDKISREGLIPTIEATFNRLDSPMPLGYSSSGTIIGLGDGMEGFSIGQRVACAGGGYAVHAEYNLVPKNLITPLPDDVEFESAAFTTLGAIALHGFRLAETQVGENVAVIGLGLLGLMTIQIANASGCNVFGIDPQQDRVELAHSFGIAAQARDSAAEAGLSFTGNRGFDAVIICADTSSNDPIELAGILSRDRGKVVATGAIGLSIPRKIYYEKELSFINSRSYGPGRYDPGYEEKGNDYPLGYVRWTEGRNFKTIVELISKKKLLVQPLITHRFNIEDASEAYQVITGKTAQKFLGVLLRYPEEKASDAKKVVFATAETNGEQNVKLGIIGAGLYANATLLPVLTKNKDVKLTAISSANGLNAAHAGKKFGFNYACTGDNEILNDQNINSVAILTRHNTHSELVCKALRAGKNVFVEKPLALNSQQLETIISALQEENSKILTVGYNRRFAPLSIEMQKFFKERSEPMFVHYRANAGFLPLNHWTQDPSVGGGRIIGEACHFVDLITSLVGQTPIKVTASALPDHGKYKTDNVTMTFTFPDGSVGVVDYLANGDKSYSKEYIEAFCGGRIAVLNDFKSLELVKDGQRKTLKTGMKQDKGHSNEIVQFVTAIKTGVPPIPYEQLIGVSNATFSAIASIEKDGMSILI